MTLTVFCVIAVVPLEMMQKDTFRFQICRQKKGVQGKLERVEREPCESYILFKWVPIVHYGSVELLLGSGTLTLRSFLSV